MKRIILTVEPGPNYIFHLPAVARVGFDSDYADRYGDTVLAGDLSLLRENRRRLVFGGGHGGDLVETLIFLPAYLGLNSPEELASFFEVLRRDIEAGKPDGQLRRYRHRLAGLLNWVSPLDFDARHRMLGGSKDLIRRLGDAYLRNFPAYLARVWPQEEPPMREAAARLAGRLGDRDLIADWEKLAGRGFASPRYEIVLCSAIKNGPNANSLGYDRTVFYHGSDPGFMADFISHETGTHLLIDLVRSKWWEEQGYPFDLVYEGYENLCKFYNAILLGRPVAYKLFGRDDRWQEVYSRICAARPGLEPDELFRAGIGQFASGSPARSEA